MSSGPLEIPVPGIVTDTATPDSSTPGTSGANTTTGVTKMPDYIDPVTASGLAGAMASNMPQMVQGAQFGLESLRLGHSQSMSQFGPIAAAAQRTAEESGSGRARDMQPPPVFVNPK